MAAPAVEVDKRKAAQMLSVIRTQRQQALAQGGVVLSGAEEERAAKRPHLLVARPPTPATVQEEAEKADLAVSKVPKLELPECEFAQDDLDAVDERYEELSNMKRRCLWLLKQVVVLEGERKKARSGSIANG